MQDRLAGQSRRKRGVGSGRSQPALLADRAFDRDGNRLTPTYAVKGGRRYRYYVSAPLVRGEPCANGVRVPAADLERLVTGAVAGHLGNGVWVAEQFGAGLEVADMQRLVQAAETLAGQVGAGRSDGPAAFPELVRDLIARVVVGGKQVIINLDRAALLERLAKIDATPALPCVPAIPLLGQPPIEITVPAQALRCGKEVRMVLGEVHNTSPSPDPALIGLLLDAHRWFEDLRTGRVESIAALAKRYGQQAPHVSRTLGLAFLAPDIVEAVLSGCQPVTLTPGRLNPRRPLPLRWDEQRRRLLG